MYIPTSVLVPGVLSSVDYTIGADVTMTNASQWYDGPSGNFVAGTWFIVWKILFKTAVTTQTEAYSGRLWDGSVVYDETGAGFPSLAANNNIMCQGQALVTLAAVTTLKISGNAARAGQILAADVQDNSATTHTASRLTGLKIA